VKTSSRRTGSTLDFGQSSVSDMCPTRSVRVERRFDKQFDLAHARTTALGASNVKRIARLQSQERVTNRINSTEHRSLRGGYAKGLRGRLPSKFWPELRIRNAAAQTRTVSGGWLWPGRRELSCYFKYMERARIPEFESYDPSHAVVSPHRDWYEKVPSRIAAPGLWSVLL
jgi:hypothetical protein